jgi:chromosome segregation ATPase
MGKRQIRELEEKVKTLQDENLEITRLKENLNLDRIREERSYKMRISEITSECKGLEGELCSLKQEISKLKQEIQDEKKEKEEQRTKNLESSQEIDKLKNMYSQRVHEYNIEVNQLKAIQVQDKSKDEAKIREENLKNSKLENILKKKEEILQSLKEELIVKDQEADRRVKEIREEIGENIGKLEFEKKDLEQEISRLNVKLIDLDNQHNLIRKDLENVGLFVLKIRKICH